MFRLDNVLEVFTNVVLKEQGRQNILIEVKLAANWLFIVSLSLYEGTTSVTDAGWSCDKGAYSQPLVAAAKCAGRWTLLSVLLYSIRQPISGNIKTKDDDEHYQIERSIGSYAKCYAL